MSNSQALTCRQLKEILEHLDDDAWVYIHLEDDIVAVAEAWITHSDLNLEPML